MADKPAKKLPSLAITCTDSCCEKGLHAFKPKPKMTADEIGSCRSCGADDLIDWQRVHQRDPNDFDYLRQCLDKELIRHELWAIEVPVHVRQLAERPHRPLDEMLANAVRRAIEPTAAELHPWDGRQTPLPDSEKARIYHYGQHATATCCRQCLAYWHGIATDVRLGRPELDYATGLVRRYVKERLFVDDRH